MIIRLFKNMIFSNNLSYSSLNLYYICLLLIAPPWPNDTTKHCSRFYLYTLKTLSLQSTGYEYTSIYCISLFVEVVHDGRMCHQLLTIEQPNPQPNISIYNTRFTTVFPCISLIGCVRWSVGRSVTHS